METHLRRRTKMIMPKLSAEERVKLIQFCLDAAFAIEGAEGEYIVEYRQKLDGMSDLDLDLEADWWDYLLSK
jgi:hypothetical protein